MNFKNIRKFLYEIINYVIIKYAVIFSFFLQNYEEKRLKRPLMAPKKIRFTTPKKTVRFNSNVPTIFRKPTKCWICCEPLCYGFIAISVVIAIIFLAAVFVTLFPVPLQKLKMWIKHEKSFTTYQSSTGVSSNKDISLEMVPCKRLTVHKVWSKAISRLNSETPVRKVDLNGDVIDDIVIGFGIGGMNIFFVQNYYKFRIV